MSTIEDFENAPVGATATNQDGSVRVWKETETNCLPWVYITYDEWFSNEELVERGFTLNPAAPTTAREALDLAWELAHPVEEGQVIPKGTRFLQRDEYVLLREDVILDEWKHNKTPDNIRTLDPLPDPEPDWLDAPAVLAHVDDHIFQQTAVFTPTGDLPNRWTRAETMWTFHWNELRDVVPLYPKGQDA